ncbi:hypothetical protein GPECTOR_1g442 [Gonium pectorale]|uniref:Tetratricopeptide repeat protein n=1 Tax=Gonium pectorale TaxID=33097 RepID=A0A150H388_GONPE|nr:hypothetical protein GPECTOR_1g442 [Gonium pectorale]|eukprot:KXZ56494.1 hypothetical protein GPECTOR_1g442 [Gonium pectorale]
MQALIRWGGALLELAHLRPAEEAVELIEEAIARLRQAADIDAGDTDVHWRLGNAHTSLGLLTANQPAAMESFAEATRLFRRCLEQAPFYYKAKRSYIAGNGLRVLLGS